MSKMGLLGVTRTVYVRAFVVEAIQASTAGLKHAGPDSKPSWNRSCQSHLYDAVEGEL